MSDTAQLACTPLHDWHAQNGGRMVDFAGWSMPVQYSSIVEEHQATRSAVGLFDISHMGRLAVTGEEATAFLDRMLTRRITGMKPGQIRYSLVCNESGGILDDILAYKLAEPSEGYTLVVNASNREKIVAWLNQHSSGDVQIEDQTFAKAMIAVQGPQAVALLDDLFNCDLLSMRYYTGKRVTINGHDCYLSRTGYTGEDGCEIICDAEQAVTLWDQLHTAATPLGGKATGLAARDTLRLEAGMPLYGHELSETINPLQAGLDFAVNLQDRDFVGRDAIANFKQQDGQTVRVGLQLEGRRAAREGNRILHDGEDVGVVTSGTFSPTFQRPIAMGYVKETSAAVGMALAVDIRGSQHPATVVPLPFYQRGKT